LVKPDPALADKKHESAAIKNMLVTENLPFLVIGISSISKKDTSSW